MDPEFGDTRSLTLELSPTKIELRQRCWFSLNETTQVVNGLAYSELNTQVNSSNITFKLTAINSCGLNASTNLILVANQSSLHCFEMHFVFNATRNYACEFMAVDSFVRKVTQYLGFDAKQDIAVVTYSRVSQMGKVFTVKIAILPSQVSCAPCDVVQISSLTKKFLRQSDNKIQERFKSFMSPAFGVASISTKRLGACAPILFTSTQ